MAGASSPATPHPSSGHEVKPPAHLGWHIWAGQALRGDNRIHLSGDAPRRQLVALLVSAV
eukprot:131987-Prymnesium_polylepis.1